MIDKNFIDDLEYKVTGACIEVHRAWGLGLLEKIYRKCLIRELLLRNISFVSDQVVTVSYKGMLLDTYVGKQNYMCRIKTPKTP